MDLLPYITGVAIDHEVLVYGLMTVLAAAAGPIVSIGAGILLRWDYFHFVPLYASLMAGELIGDVIWYALGARFGHHVTSRFGRYFGITEVLVSKVEALYRRHHDLILIVSKLTTGFGFATVVLFTAGVAKISFRRYLIINLIGQFVWSAFLISAGFFFADLYATFDNVFDRVSLIASTILILVLVVRYTVYLRNRIISTPS